MSENKNEQNNLTPQEKKPNVFKRIGAKIARVYRAFVRAIHERTAEVKHAKAKRIAVGVFVVLFAILFVAFYLTVGRMIAAFIEDSNSFKEWIEGFDKWSVMIFILLRVIQTVFKLIPGGPLEIAAGFAFGVWEGFLWCMVGSLIGSAIILFIGKKYGIKLVGLFVAPEKIHSASMLVDKKTRNFAFFLMYFLPGTPKDIFTWVASITDENVIGFTALTMLARIPSVLISTWCGHELMDENYLLSALIFGALIVCTIVGGIIYKMISSRHHEHVETEKPPENAE